MISHNHECIFVHVPKTGGQSVETVFLELHGLTWATREPLLMRPNPDPAKGPAHLAHLKAREYVDLGYVDAATFDRYFKFSFVRNPWDRLVSEYRYLRLDGKTPFSFFVNESLAKTDEYSDIARHVCPQIDFLTDAQGKLIVDFVGRFETFADDFDVVARRLGLGGVALPHQNASRGRTPSRLRRLFAGTGGKDKRRPYQHYYDDELRDRVTGFYSRDIERFGYSFEGSFACKPIV